VLPTSGTSRSTGGLSVFTFLRVRTWLRADATAPGGAADDAAGLAALIDDSAALARLEGLHGHAAAALARRRFLPKEAAA
jgi:phosphoribosyl-ATP pyrophosphohydrolase/phosphoribosyl-AMP cyclohydrolase/histidinol dehydrogenase